MRRRYIAIFLVAVIIGGLVVFSLIQNQIPVTNGEQHIVLRVNVPEVTPSEDTIFVETDDHVQIEMNKINDYQWELNLNKILNSWPPDDEFQYRYNRNGLGYVAAEKFHPDSDSYWRVLSSANQTDQVERWRWIPNEPLTGFTIPEVPSFPSRIDNKSYLTGACLLDYFTPEFTPLIEPTIEHIAAMNGKWVHIADIYPVVSVNPVSFALDEGIPLEVLTTQVEKANELGLDVAVTLALDECRNSTVREELSSLLSEEWFDEFFLAFNGLWEDKLDEYESLGVDMVMVPSHGFYPENNSLKSYVNFKIKEQVALIRSKFSGLLSSDWVMGDEFDFYDDLDIVGTKFMPAGMPENATSYHDFVKVLDQYIDDSILPIYETYNKPLLLVMGFPSYEGAAQNPDLLEDPRVWEFFPETDEFPLDLQVQIDLYAAALTVLGNHTWVKGSFVFGYCYWDSIDKSPSVRAKPAEIMFQQWYSVLNGLGTF